MKQANDRLGVKIVGGLKKLLPPGQEHLCWWIYAGNWNWIN